MVSTAKCACLQLKETFAEEGKELRFKTSSYAHDKQFRRLQRVIKRQRTILGVVIRVVQRKLQGEGLEPEHPKAMSNLLSMWLERAERIRTQSELTRTSCTLYMRRRWNALARAKPESPTSSASRAPLWCPPQHGLMLGARSFPSNPYDDHILSAVLDQATKSDSEPGRQAQVHRGRSGLSRRGRR